MIIIKMTRKICENNLSQLLRLIKFKREIDKHGYDYWGKEHFLKELPKKWNCSYLAFDENKLIGFVVCYLKSSDELRLSKIYILKEYRNLGIGGLFLEKFIYDAKKNRVDKATTCAADFNQGMMRFLERHRFIRTFTWSSINNVTYFNYERDIRND